MFVVWLRVCVVSVSLHGSFHSRCSLITTVSTVNDARPTKYKHVKRISLRLLTFTGFFPAVPVIAGLALRTPSFLVGVLAKKRRIAFPELRLHRDVPFPLRHFLGFNLHLRFQP